MTIEEYAFDECKNFRKIVFLDDNKLTTIERGCFYGSGLEEFLAPKSLKKIGKNAF